MSETGPEIELTAYQIDKIRMYLADRGRLLAAVGLSVSARRRSPRARKLAARDLAAITSALWEKINDKNLRKRLEDSICRRMDWCNRKHDGLFNVIVSAAKILLALLKGVAGALAQIVLIVQEAMFDRLCNCPPRPGRP